MPPSNPYDLIKRETANYKTTQVPLADGWEWNMHDHVRRSFLYKNSKFSKGADDGTRPFKNIIRPILNVAYRSEGFDVKDIVPFVNDPKNYYKSFLVKKFHSKWARENDIDTFIDELVESYVDYGLALVKNVNNVRPEVVPLQRLAFCDQTDILSGPICELHHYTPDQLSDMKGKWYDAEIDQAIIQCTTTKTVPLANDNKAQTPSKYIEVYELHGTFPDSWLNKTEGESDGNEISYSKQIHIITFYPSADGNKNGICLYKGKERDERYKAIKRDPIFGRACGFGGVEELFEPQVWTNYSELQLKEMLDVASLMLLQTADKTLATRNKLTDLSKGEIIHHQKDEPLTQVTIQPQNKEAFDTNVMKWEQTARTIGSADEALLGEQPTSGTPFRLQALITQEGKGLHDYRQGKIATFVGEIYRDWVLDHLVREINKGQQFIDELSGDELIEIADRVITNLTNEKIKQKVIGGTIPSEEETELFKEVTRTNFMRGGQKRFMEIVKDEIRDIPLDVEVNVAGKQKDLADQAEKLTNIFRAVIGNPEVLQAPAMGKLFNEIIESAGFSPLDFTSFTKTTQKPEPQEPAQAVPSPLELPANV